MGIVSKDEFLREYSRALTEDRASAFVGAGFSVGAGFVDWRALLREIAADLGLSVDEEHDLIAVAPSTNSTTVGPVINWNVQLYREFVSKGTLAFTCLAGSPPPAISMDNQLRSAVGTGF